MVSKGREFLAVWRWLDCGGVTALEDFPLVDFLRTYLSTIN